MALQDIPRRSEPLVSADLRLTDLWQAWFEQLVLAVQTLELPRYGDALPDPATYPDGAYFTVTPGQDLYQLQDGAWEAL